MNNLFDSLIETIKNNFNLRKIKVSDILEIFKKHSFLGQMNKAQLWNSYYEIYDLSEINSGTVTNKSEKFDKINKLITFSTISKSEIFSVQDVIIGIINLTDSSNNEKLDAVFSFNENYENQHNNVLFEDVFKYFYLTFNFFIQFIFYKKLIVFDKEVIIEMAQEMTKDIFTINKLKENEFISIMHILNYLEAL
jgi:hypothetical protein